MSELEKWIAAQDFWKSDLYEWQEMYDILASYGMAESDILEFFDMFLLLVKQEYGE